jgi:hypothetical protein
MRRATVVVVSAFLGLAGLIGPQSVAGDPGPVRIVVTEKSLDLLVGDGLVARYHTDAKLPKPHFHPVNGPHGKPVTRGYPMVPDVPGESKDHPHHRGVWFGHQETIPEGLSLKRPFKPDKGLDFWSEPPGHGREVCVKVEEPKQDGRHAWVRTHNEYRSADGEKVMDEVRTIHLVDLGSAKLVVIDFDMQATVAPMVFGDNKDGVFGIRVAETMCEKKGQGGVLENAEGKRGAGGDNRERQGCWGLKSAWCDYSGPVDGQTVGVALLDHPRNPYPAYWHARDYGLLSANPFGRAKARFPDAAVLTDLVRIPKGERLTLRYGLLVHPGDAKEGRVAEHYQAYLKVE